MRKMCRDPRNVYGLGLNPLTRFRKSIASCVPTSPPCASWRPVCGRRTGTQSQCCSSNPWRIAQASCIRYACAFQRNGWCKVGSGGTRRVGRSCGHGLGVHRAIECVRGVHARMPDGGGLEVGRGRRHSAGIESGDLARFHCIWKWEAQRWNLVDP